jgi:aromatic ring-cleaving dioxygenase
MWSVGSRSTHGGLVVLVDPDAGDAVKDHTEHAIRSGAIRPLDVSVLQKGWTSRQC